MQPPGKKNALGKIKFKFPNRYAVYLHDTPTRYLFKRDKRAFSHGCVRVSQPKELLKTIATFNSNINLKKADKILKGKRQRQINIKNKLPIYLVYLTAGFNSESKELEFREDIYNYDKMQNIEKY
jgi:murein L,D-transpeptidase YcbB/YkuD